MKQSNRNTELILNCNNPDWDSHHRIDIDSQNMLMNENAWRSVEAWRLEDVEAWPGNDLNDARGVRVAGAGVVPV